MWKILSGVWCFLWHEDCAPSVAYQNWFATSDRKKNKIKIYLRLIAYFFEYVSILWTCNQSYFSFLNAEGFVWRQPIILIIRKDKHDMYKRLCICNCTAHENIRSLFFPSNHLRKITNGHKYFRAVQLKSQIHSFLKF